MVTTVANIEMAAAWDGDEGDDWARDWRRYDRAVAAYDLPLLDAATIRAGDRVLDVGCGTGKTSRDAGRVAKYGSVLGVDLSSRMIERAGELARAEGLADVRFEQGDAQVHPFQRGWFDLAVSRFGAMFFEDQEAAFTNIGAALRPRGRLAMVGWREAADNEWLRCVFAALSLGRELPVPPPGRPGPFGLADTEATTAALTAAGFRGIRFTAINRPFWFGADTDDAFAYFSGTGIVRGLTEGLDELERAEALAALRATIADHDGAGGVRFGSGAWLVTARKAAR
jgi:SAM-dependent methyltransferase